MVVPQPTAVFDGRKEYIPGPRNITSASMINPLEDELYTNENEEPHTPPRRHNQGFLTKEHQSMNRTPQTHRTLSGDNVTMPMIEKYMRLITELDVPIQKTRREWMKSDPQSDARIILSANFETLLRMSIHKVKSQEVYTFFQMVMNGMSTPERRKKSRQVERSVERSSRNMRIPSLTEDLASEWGKIKESASETFRLVEDRHRKGLSLVTGDRPVEPIPIQNFLSSPNEPEENSVRLGYGRFAAQTSSMYDFTKTPTRSNTFMTPT